MPSAADVIDGVGVGAQLSETLFGFVSNMTSARKEMLSIIQEVT